ncbi:MAG TPA: protoporphyrinogen oxidase, partial [Prolixibacteraceae bacterium]|nr:protoporphyrinogen oxidase [Prolixibacteraceae bacterium]
AVATPLFTLNDKFRILGEPFRKKGTNANETLSEFVKRRLGCSFLNYAVDPFISGVYAGDPNYLITRFALPKLYALEQNYGSFIKGSINKAKERKHNLRLQKATREVFSVQGGLKNLINALTEKVGANNILLNVKNTSIKLTTKGFEISTTINNETIIFQSEKVITTTGGYELKNLLPFLSDEELAPFEELKYASVVQAIVGYKNWEGIKLNAFGGLVPTIEHRDILGVLFNSSFLNGRSPKNGALLSVFLGGTKRPDIFEMNDNEVEEIVSRELLQMMKIHSFKPDLFKIFRYKNAIPQYGLSTEKRYETIDQIQQKYPGLVLAGNIRNGIGMADRIKQARTIAEELF